MFMCNYTCGILVLYQQFLNIFLGIKTKTVSPQHAIPIIPCVCEKVNQVCKVF